MSENRDNHCDFWFRYLHYITISLILFGLIMVTMPTLTYRAFSLLIYSEAYTLHKFGPEALAYIKLTHCVIGALIVGWGVLLLLLLNKLFHKHTFLVLSLYTLSLLAWFILDTSMSLILGFWQNAVLNFILLILFAIPLTVIYKKIKDR